MGDSTGPEGPREGKVILFVRPGKTLPVDDATTSVGGVETVGEFVGDSLDLALHLPNPPPSEVSLRADVPQAERSETVLRRVRKPRKPKVGLPTGNKSPEDVYGDSCSICETAVVAMRREGTPFIGVESKKTCVPLTEPEVFAQLTSLEVPTESSVARILVQWVHFRSLNNRKIKSLVLALAQERLRYVASFLMEFKTRLADLPPVGSSEPADLRAAVRHGAERVIEAVDPVLDLGAQGLSGPNASKIRESSEHPPRLIPDPSGLVDKEK